MDGREQLRRYLEQRRETGERDLVLDALNVDEVLKLVGAKPGKTPAKAIPPKAIPGAPGPDRASADWRDVLRESGAAPKTGEERGEERGVAASAGAPHVPAGISIGAADRELF